MGGSFSACIDTQGSSLPRLHYDMTPIMSRPLPILWLVGPPGSGRGTHSLLLSENLEYEIIRVGQLLKKEALKDSDRGHMIKNGLHNNKRLPDSIVVDLIKEEMLQRPGAKGFIIDNFPKTSKQAALFEEEIGDVDAVVFLIDDIQVMVRRYRQKHEEQPDEDAVRKKITTYIKEAKEGIAKFGHKIEKIHTNEPLTDVYDKILAAVNIRISAKTKITSESDYAQKHASGALSIN